jgi:hypothetical protein
MMTDQLTRIFCTCSQGVTAGFRQRKCELLKMLSKPAQPAIQHLTHSSIFPRTRTPGLSRMSTIARNLVCPSKVPSTFSIFLPLARTLGLVISFRRTAASIGSGTSLGRCHRPADRTSLRCRWRRAADLRNGKSLPMDLGT